MLWENPKYSGIVLVLSLLLIELIARNSFLFNVGIVLLASMSVVGSYRLYVFIMTRVKGVEDHTFK